MIGVILVVIGLFLVGAGAGYLHNQNDILRLENTEAKLKLAEESQRLSSAFADLKSSCFVRLLEIGDLQSDHDNLLKAHDIEIDRLKEKTRAPK